MAWLNNALDDEVLEVVRGPQGAITRNTRWQDVYVRAGFSRGAQHAEEAMRRTGIPFPEQTAEQLFRIPTNAATLANLYSRQFNELQGITQSASQQIGRVLTEGLATGQGPRDMAREMRRAVQTIGRNRSVTMARTEIINAHAESTLNRYADAGVDGVTAQAEFLTAQDDLVCPECQALETGEALALDEARGVIPVHPNCRCVWLPVVG
jgi:SPP1 gp7 family putative phage head morphogenesis protein